MACLQSRVKDSGGAGQLPSGTLSHSLLLPGASSAQTTAPTTGWGQQLAEPQVVFLNTACRVLQRLRAEHSAPRAYPPCREACKQPRPAAGCPFFPQLNTQEQPLPAPSSPPTAQAHPYWDPLGSHSPGEQQEPPCPFPSPIVETLPYLGVRSPVPRGS